MRICLYVFLCLLSFNSASAQTCEWDSWQDLGKAVIENAPEIKILKEEGNYRNSLVESAALKPPSVLNGQYTVGGMPWKSSNLEASYLWTLESQDKRQARLDAARAEADIVPHEIENRRAALLLHLALLQQNFRRIEARRDVLLETQATYLKIIQQYKQRPSLGPEQEASLAVFTIAKRENDLKIETLDVEKSRLTYQLGSITGCSSPQLPRTPTPTTRLKVDENNAPSSEIRLLEARAKSLDRSLQAEIKSFQTDVSVGPMLIAGRDDDDNKLEFGVAFSLPLAADRVTTLTTSKSAEFRARRAEIDLRIARKRIERDAWMDQYRRSEKAMKGGLSKDELSRTHRKLEALFQGERVSAALVIESHRQLLEHITSFSELESKAIEAIWNIRYLDGTIAWSDL